MADFVLKYGANVGDILAALNKVDKANEKMYQKAEKAANKALKGIITDHNKLLSLSSKLDKALTQEAKAAEKLSKSGGKVSGGGAGGMSGASIGVLGGAVGALTNQFIELGKQAVSVLIDIGKQSIQTALEMDTLRTRLVGIFDGSQEAADQAFGFIQDRSRALGMDLSELAGAFLPKVESMQQFERVAKIAAALAKSDPEQGAIGARIALIEALSGTFTSLQRRFEIPKEDINRIQQAFDTQGMEGFVSTLEQVLAESGKDFDTLANTAQASFDKVSIAGQQLGGRFGDPIVASLENLANKFLEFYDANEEDLIVLADTLGRAVGSVIDAIAAIDFSQIDVKQLIEIADNIFNVIQAIQMVATELAPVAEGWWAVNEAINPAYKLFEILVQVLSGVDEAMVTLAQIVALAKAGFVEWAVILEPFINNLQEMGAAIGNLASGDMQGFMDALDNIAVKLPDMAKAQAAYKESILESSKNINDYTSKVDGNKKAQDDLRNSLQETKKAGTGAADAILSGKQANKAAEQSAGDQAEAQQKLAEKIKKTNEDIAETNEQLAEKLEDIDIEAERKRMDVAVEAANKRVDLAQKNADEIADIRRKNAQDIADAATDLRRDEEDIARKYADETINNEQEKRNDILEVEKAYRDELKNIQAEFNQSAGDAERKRDAIAFLEAVRQRDQAITNAKDERQTGLTEAQVAAKTRQEETNKQREQELEEARITNERKLEDLKTALGRQLEEQNISYQRELENIKVWEARKLEELKLARERDIEDARRANARKLADLQQALADEQAAVTGGATGATAGATGGAGGSGAPSSAQVRATLNQRAFGGGSGVSLPQGGTTGSLNSSTASLYANMIRASLGNLPGFASGGAVRAGQPIMVGENGPEPFIPQTSGLILPNMSPTSAISNYSNSRQMSVNLPMATANQLLEPVMVAQLRNIIGGMLGELM